MPNVTRADDESWTFQCPGVPGDPCGDTDSGGSFRSSGWPTKKVAEARGAHHALEHGDGTLMPSLDDFRSEHGLAPHADGYRAVDVARAESMEAAVASAERTNAQIQEALKKRTSR